MRFPNFDQKQMAYLIPAALYTLWQSCVGWLNTYWTLNKLGNNFTILNYVLFFFAHGVGTAVFALWLDKGPSLKYQKAAALFSAMMTGALTASMAFGNGTWLIAASIAYGLTGGFFTAYLSFFVFREIPPEKRGVTLGFSAAFGIAAHFIVFTLLFPQQNGTILYGKTFFAVVIVLLTGIAALWYPVCRDNLWPESVRSLTECGYTFHTSTHKPHFMLLLISLLFFFFMSYGMQDFAATAYWMDGKGFLVYTRLFLIAGFIISGSVWDWKSRNVLMNASFGLLAMGFICMAFQYRGAASFIGFSSVQLTAAFFSLSVRLIFLDVAKFYQNPAFIGSLGLVLPFFLKQAGILSAGVLYGALGGMAVFVSSLIFIIAGMPLGALLFEKIRDMNILSIRGVTVIQNAPEDQTECFPDKKEKTGEALEETFHSHKKATTENIISVSPSVSNTLTMTERLTRKYGFTKRESQIMELSLHGLTIPEMAQNLNISEPTVKHYIRRILEKTGVKNQKQLLSMLIEKKI